MGSRRAARRRRHARYRADRKALKRAIAHLPAVVAVLGEALTACVAAIPHWCQSLERQAHAMTYSMTRAVECLLRQQEADRLAGIARPSPTLYAEIRPAYLDPPQVPA